MVGVFCFSSMKWADGIDDRIHLFGDQQSALRLMEKVLVDAGEIIVVDGNQWRIEGLTELFTSFDDALNRWSEKLESLEFFHIYECECRDGVPLVDFGV